MRIRHLFHIGGSVAVCVALFWTDPDQGVGTGMILLGAFSCILAVALAHWSRKAMFDYPDASMEKLFGMASKSSIGSGLALLALAIVIYGLLGLFGKAVHAEEIPANALIYAPVLKAEQQRFWPDHPRPELLAGLVDQETCGSLKSARCWSPAARLKSAREEGAGLGQITRAYRADGSERFDSLAAMRAQYPPLRDWTWDNVYQRPDLQLRAIVLMSRGNFMALRMVSASNARRAFADAAYNGGLQGVQQERRACSLKTGCDQQQWFGHVEHVCLKSRVALYGQRNACDINREHVRMVLRVRSAKYQRLMA